MASVAEQIHDKAVLHRIALSRYSTSVVRKVMALLNRSEEAMILRLARTSNETIAAERLEQLISDVRAIQAQGWELVKTRVNTETVDLAEAEAQFASKLVRLDPQAAVGVFSPTPPINQIVAAVNARPFQGRFLKGWLDEAEEGATRLVRDTIRQAFVEGRTTEDVIRSIRGTKAAQYKNGIMEVSRRRAEAMVRTAMTHTANVSTQATYEHLGVKQWVFTATLDARTTVICGGLHGKKFDVGKGPQPPRHVNCRSTSVPVVGEIPGVKPFEFPSYEAWLRKQSAATQSDILGATKAKLFRDGSLSIDRFTDKGGKVLTIAELRARDAAAFEKAGVTV